MKWKEKTILSSKAFFSLSVAINNCVCCYSEKFDRCRIWNTYRSYLIQYNEIPIMRH